MNCNNVAPWLTVDQLQEELERFAEQSLRRNLLMELRAELRYDFQDALSNVLKGGGTNMRSAVESTTVTTISSRPGAPPAPGQVPVSTLRMEADSPDAKAPPILNDDDQRPARPNTPLCWQGSEDDRNASKLTLANKLAEPAGKGKEQVISAPEKPLKPPPAPRGKSAVLKRASITTETKKRMKESHDKFFVDTDAATAGPQYARVRMELEESKRRRAKTGAGATLAKTFKARNERKGAHLDRAYDERHFDYRESPLKRFVHFIAVTLENSVSFLILLNGIFMGVQTDYQARNCTEAVPRIFSVVEMIFCIVFTVELALKLLAYRQQFFFMKDWAWNLFDCLLVMIQLVEVIGMIASDHESDDESKSASPVGNLSFLRLLRILRLLRVLRLVRLLRFVGELAEIISSITSSLRPFMWTVMLLLIIMYMVAIVFTQIVFTRRFEMKSEVDFPQEEDDQLRYWWGGLARSVFSLYQSILGGVDWESVTSPLQTSIHPVLPAVVFSIYIAFTVLCMMNIITGTFVNGAMKECENQKEREFAEYTRAMFKEIDEEDVGVVTFDTLLELLEDDNFQHHLRLIGISEKDARLLFSLLDNEDLKEVEFEKFMANILRLHQEAKFLDIMKLMYIVEGNQALLSNFSRLSTSTQFQGKPNRGSTMSEYQNGGYSSGYYGGHPDDAAEAQNVALPDASDDVQELDLR